MLPLMMWPSWGLFARRAAAGTRFAVVNLPLVAEVPGSRMRAVDGARPSGVAAEGHRQVQLAVDDLQRLVTPASPIAPRP
jgi:hypothetical protein